MRMPSMGSEQPVGLEGNAGYAVAAGSCKTGSRPMFQAAGGRGPVRHCAITARCHSVTLTA